MAATVLVIVGAVMLTIGIAWPSSLRPRKPDFVIGGAERPYLLRWYIVPRNRWFNVYLHKIVRSDDDRALHDHPWWNLSVILSGSYLEVVPRDERQAPRHDYMPAGLTRHWRRAGHVVLRRPTARHRLEVWRPCWSLFITGPRLRTWGFHCPQGFVPWDSFVDQRDQGGVGKGCAQ